MKFSSIIAILMLAVFLFLDVTDSRPSRGNSGGTRGGTGNRGSISNGGGSSNRGSGGSSSSRTPTRSSTPTSGSGGNTRSRYTVRTTKYYRSVTTAGGYSFYGVAVIGLPYTVVHPYGYYDPYWGYYHAMDGKVYMAGSSGGSVVGVVIACVIICCCIGCIVVGKAVGGS
jgi:hypothetical protein